MGKAAAAVARRERVQSWSAREKEGVHMARSVVVVRGEE